MCHFSCATCADQLFTSCITCPTSSQLSNGACFCSTSWDSNCSGNTLFEYFLKSFDLVFVVVVALVMVLYCLRAKLLYSYRIIVGLQSLSLLLYSSQIYLYYENEYGLRTLSKANGPYLLTYRNDSLSLNTGLNSIALLGCFLSALFLGYYPMKWMKQNYEGYGQYLKDNFFPFLSNYYYFGSRMMFYFVGLWISNTTTQIPIIIIFSLFCLIIAFVVLKTLYNYHQKLTDEEICESEIHLYAMLSPAAMIGLPMISSSTFYLIVYLSPLSLLLMIVVLNRNFEVLSVKNVLFFVVELLMPGFAIAFVLLSDPYKHFAILGAMIISFILIVIEMSKVYYSGASLERSNKVHPEQPLQNDENDKEKIKKTIKTSTTKRVSYF